ncbi:MAG: ABC transporter permease [Chloroflexales bacterium]|nr:ABC transporter permease [Chloroflexales bacterium]
MFKEQIFMALDSLRANKFRSLLTMLGIIISAGTLVAVLSLGNSVQSTVFEQFVDLGTRRIAVLPGDPKAKGARDVPGYGLLSIQDYHRLERLVQQNPEIFSTIVPEIAVPVDVRAGTTSVRTSLVRTNQDYQEVQTVPVDYGRFLNDTDETASARVGVLGALVAEDLFGQNPQDLQAAIGQTVEINGQPIQVVGILSPLGGPFSSDRRVLAPVSTVRLRLVGDLDLPGRGVQMIIWFPEKWGV